MFLQATEDTRATTLPQPPTLRQISAVVAPVLLTLAVLCASISLAISIAGSPSVGCGVSSPDPQPWDSPRERAIQMAPAHAIGGAVERRRAGSRAGGDPQEKLSEAIVAPAVDVATSLRWVETHLLIAPSAHEIRLCSGSPRAPPVGCAG